MGYGDSDLINLVRSLAVTYIRCQLLRALIAHISTVWVLQYLTPGKPWSRSKGHVVQGTKNPLKN
jgi:hypothetical protein